MSEFNFEDIIEYIDNTYDEHFIEARDWAREHGTTFVELMERRALPKRYFQIGKDLSIIPEIPEPEREVTEEELKEEVRNYRNFLLFSTDYTMLPDAPILDGEKAKYLEYRQYLRDFTKKDEWWKEKVPLFDEWSKGKDV